MSNVIRFGVSLDEKLLQQFDELTAERGYQNRSEAIRDLIRQSLVQKEWEDQEGVVAGTLTMVYDHHTSNLSQKLTAIQHDHHDCIITSLHVHLDHHNCLEILVLKGPSAELHKFGQQIIATRGVKYGSLNLATTGKDLT